MCDKCKLEYLHGPPAESSESDSSSSPTPPDVDDATKRRQVNDGSAQGAGYDKGDDELKRKDKK